MIPVRYADIDLSNGQVRDYPLSEAIVRMYLGGKGLAAYILYQELAPGIDPLSADNVLIINTTPLTGTGAPCTNERPYCYGRFPIAPPPGIISARGQYNLKSRVKGRCSLETARKKSGLDTNVFIAADFGRG